LLNIIAGSLSTGAPPAPLSSYESIATVTVGSGGQSSIEFTSIPSTFAHLQIRAISRDARAATLNSLVMQVNGDTSATYSYHTIIASDSPLDSDGTGGQTSTDYLVNTGANATGGIFAASILDILDYANTNKNKTIRMFGGVDLNTNGRLNFTSAGWFNTNAITSLKFFSSSNPNFVQYTQFALYGIKGS
jgi:hypothetical protein